MEKINLLYVEDEISLAKITSNTLTKNGFSVTWADNGQKALEFLRNEHFDICVIDIMMPQMNGYAVVEEIRKTNKLLPVIFLTARTLTEDIVKGFEIGGNDYLKKPFSIEELIARIKSLLNRVNEAPESEQKHNYKIGKYQFNSFKQELIIDHKIIGLTHRESEIIRLLIENKNQVLDRKIVLKGLWGEDSFFNARSMDVFVTKIRKHFSEDSSISILNVRGVGYKLVVDL